MALQLAVQSLAASLSRSPPNKPTTKPPSNGHHQPQKPTISSSRRSLATAAAAVLIASHLLPPTMGTAGAFDLDLRITIPEQSSEEAEANVRTHARNLVRVKEYIDARSWRELQVAIRASAANLKQDLYAIIQARPGSERPELRRLYSDLFNNVTRLDYAARDKDEVQVKECYGNIVAPLAPPLASSSRGRLEGDLGFPPPPPLPYLLPLLAAARGSRRASPRGRRGRWRRGRRCFIPVVESAWFRGGGLAR